MGVDQNRSSVCILDEWCDAWPLTFSLRQGHRVFGGFGIRVGGWMTTGLKAGSVSWYTSDPHLDLKRGLFMHDCNKSPALHIYTRWDRSAQIIKAEIILQTEFPACKTRFKKNSCSLQLFLLLNTCMCVRACVFTATLTHMYLCVRTRIGVVMHVSGNGKDFSALMCLRRERERVLWNSHLASWYFCYCQRSDQWNLIGPCLPDQYWAGLNRLRPADWWQL